MRDVELLIDPVAGTIVESVDSGSENVEVLSDKLGVSEKRLRKAVDSLTREGLLKRSGDNLELNDAQIKKLNQYLSEEIDKEQRFIEEKFLGGSIDLEEYRSMNTDLDFSAVEFLENEESSSEAISENNDSSVNHEFRAKKKAFDTTEQLLNS
ncbi:MAG: hypothetical protein H8Z69_03470 [Nanohaloarchaea archaeon]|nr:hypothetical protein [Candidatus Nanohaloarchaea archaeon]